MHNIHLIASPCVQYKNTTTSPTHLHTGSKYERWVLDEPQVGPSVDQIAEYLHPTLHACGKHWTKPAHHSPVLCPAVHQELHDVKTIGDDGGIYRRTEITLAVGIDVTVKQFLHDTIVTFEGSIVYGLLYDSFGRIPSVGHIEETHDVGMSIDEFDQVLIVPIRTSLI